MQKLLATLQRALSRKRRIIAVSNEKGGVGKTTISFHIVKLLAKIGKKVLVLEADPQGNLTKVLNSHVALSGEFLKEKGYLTSADMYKDTLPEGYSIYPISENISLLPGTPELEDVEALPLQSIQFPTSHLSILAQDFDVVIIDCPPAPGNRQLAGQLASDVILMPLELDSFSMDGVASAYERVHNLFEIVEQDMPEVLLMPNRCNKRSNTFNVNYELLKNTDFFVAPPIFARQPIQDAVSDGAAVWEVKNGNARDAGKIVMNALVETLVEAFK